MPEQAPRPASAVRTDAVVGNRILALLVVIHALHHLIGFTLSWRLIEVAPFGFEDVTPAAGSAAGRLVAIGWLGAAIGFAVVAWFLVRGDRRARRWAVGSALLSLAVGIPSVDVALAGMVVDIAILAAVVIAGRSAARAAAGRSAGLR